MKTLAATQYQHLADSITSIWFIAFDLDSEVFLKANSFGDGHVHEDNHTNIVVNVYDILDIDKDPGYFMEALKSLYIIKSDSIKPPTSCLGSGIGDFYKHISAIVGSQNFKKV